VEECEGDGQGEVVEKNGDGRGSLQVEKSDRISGGGRSFGYSFSGACEAFESEYWTYQNCIELSTALRLGRLPTEQKLV